MVQLRAFFSADLSLCEQGLRSKEGIEAHKEHYEQELISSNQLLKSLQDEFRPERSMKIIVL